MAVFLGLSFGIDPETSYCVSPFRIIFEFRHCRLKVPRGLDFIRVILIIMFMMKTRNLSPWNLIGSVPGVFLL